MNFFYPCNFEFSNFGMQMFKNTESVMSFIYIVRILLKWLKKMLCSVIPFPRCFPLLSYLSEFLP